MSIQSANILDTDTVILEVPAGRTYAVTTLLICNYAENEDEANNSSFDMHIIRSGNIKSNVNKVLNDIIMPPKETFTFNVERIVLDEGDSIVLNSTNPNVLSATISFLEV